MAYIYLYNTIEVKADKVFLTKLGIILLLQFNAVLKRSIASCQEKSVVTRKGVSSV